MHAETDSLVFEVPCVVTNKWEISNPTFCYQTVEIKSYYDSSQQKRDSFFFPMNIHSPQ